MVPVARQLVRSVPLVRPQTGSVRCLGPLVQAGVSWPLIPLGIGQEATRVPLIWAEARLKIEAESFICLDS